jgi:capsular polysaccharide biosynthesis protein
VEIRDYLRILIKRIWIIALLAVITAGSAFAMSKVQTPVYRSTIVLNVWAGRLDWGLQQTIKGLMRNWAANITSRTTAMRVIDRLQLDITPEELSRKVTASPVDADFIIRIDADDYDPIIARDIAQTTAEIFTADIKEFMLEQDKQDRVEIFIRDNAQPGILHKPKWKTNTLAGGIFGVLVGMIVIFVLEWLESDVLRSSEDIERQTGLVVLGVIPTANAGPSRTRRQPSRASAH